ncbi:MAG: hypothetical protein IPH66_12960 [Crocinitomicaceae bacterium]|nr:hypothetical protein [Crocinitomicaceae bacterium]
MNPKIMDPLSSFAIKVAAGIALKLIQGPQGEVKYQMKKAYKKALKLWSPNVWIRWRNQNRIKLYFTELFENPDQQINVHLENTELQRFFEKYNEALAQFPSAYAHVKDIKDEARFKIVIRHFQNIERKIDVLDDGQKKMMDYLEKNLINSDKKLEIEWRRQLSVYRESMEKFKPQTALDLLNELNNSFVINNTNPHHTIKASIEFLKAQCYGMLGDTAVYRAFINAHKLDATSKLFKEWACFGYAKIGELNESKRLIDEILAEDNLNLMAWVVKVIISTTDDLRKELMAVPKIVIEKMDFKRILYFNTRSNPQFLDLLEAYQKFAIIPELSEYNDETLTFSTYKTKMFLITTAVTKILQTTGFDLNRPYIGNIELLRQVKPTLDKFLDDIKDSEIGLDFQLFELFRHYIDFIILKQKESALKMKFVFSSLTTKDEPYVMMTGNTLQHVKEFDLAIEVINSLKDKSAEIVLLEAICFLKKGDIKNFARCSREFISKITFVDENRCSQILDIQNHLYFHYKENEIDVYETLKDKEFENDHLKNLISEFCAITRKNNDTETITNLKKIETFLLESKSPWIYYVAYSYFLLNEFEITAELCQKFVRDDVESQELEIYIKSLHKSKSNHKELLRLLKVWRTKFSYNEELLMIEANLCKQVLDWERCVEICEFQSSKSKDQEFFLSLYLVSLSRSNMDQKTSKINELVDKFRTFKFKFYNNASVVSRALVENNHHRIALDVLYPFAIEKENKPARMEYFMLSIGLPSQLIKENEIVEIGWFVKYQLNKESAKFIEIVEGNHLAKELLGKHVNDVFSIKRQMVGTTDTVRILRIMDKYLHLSELIMDEVTNDPHSGMPMQSIQIEKDNPNALIETLLSTVGADAAERENNAENAFQKYYSNKLSFSELVAVNYSSNHIQGYFNLTRYREGFTIIPRVAFPQIDLTKRNLVLDFSSLLIIFQIHWEVKTEFPGKFLISAAIRDFIKDYLKQENALPRPEMSITFTTAGIVHSVKPEDVYKNNVAYLNNLLEFIDKKCTVVIAESKLDLSRKLDQKLDDLPIVHYLIDTLAVVTENDGILISDDAFFLKFLNYKNGQIISSEKYVELALGEESKYKYEFVKSKYIGLTISNELIKLEFDKKRKGQENFYDNCIANLSVSLNPNELNIYTCVEFLKEIASDSSLSEKELIQEGTHLFVSLLKGQKELKVFRGVAFLIQKEFQNDPVKLGSMFTAYDEALRVLGVPKEN